MRNRLVSPRGKGWAGQGAGVRTTSHRTQATAYEAAKAALKPRGGEVKVQGRNGKIRISNTIRPARDPRRSRG